MILIILKHTHKRTIILKHDSKIADLFTDYWFSWILLSLVDIDSSLLKVYIIFISVNYFTLMRLYLWFEGIFLLHLRIFVSDENDEKLTDGALIDNMKM